MIAEFGERAGWVIGVAARATPEPERRRRFLALVEEIERIAGFGWVFGDKEEATAEAQVVGVSERWRRDGVSCCGA